MGDLRTFASTELAGRRDPVAAAAMQTYMRTDMPFFGVRRPERRSIEGELARRFPPADAASYRANVLALWKLPHREEKYLALTYARVFPIHVVPAQLDLYEQLVREGAWWDLVDEVAVRLVGRVLLDHHNTTRPVVERWIDDDDLWIRRAAIIGQIGHREATDAAMLFDFCARRLHERDFFIRKAIGWALREYAKTAPDQVKEWVELHCEEISALSRREALKHLS